MSKSNYNSMKSSILGINISPTSYKQTCGTIVQWQENCESRMVCFANVHMVMTAYDNPGYKRIINDADLVTPDGMPLVWTLRRKGYPHQERVYGPTLTQKLLERLKDSGIPVGFLGSTPEVLGKLKDAVQTQYPGTNVVYSFSPPFRELTEEEDEELVNAINESGARILFVGLGCPKQEVWMHAHRGKVKAVMLGVGAAFDFIAGVKSQAPLWIQRLGMEWFYRLVTEPKRLWRRYFYNNPRFVVLVFRQLLRMKREK